MFRDVFQLNSTRIMNFFFFWRQVPRFVREVKASLPHWNEGAIEVAAGGSNGSRKLAAISFSVAFADGSTDCGGAAQPKGIVFFVGKLPGCCEGRSSLNPNASCIRFFGLRGLTFMQDSGESRWHFSSSPKTCRAPCQHPPPGVNGLGNGSILGGVGLAQSLH